MFSNWEGTHSIAAIKNYLLWFSQIEILSKKIKFNLKASLGIFNFEDKKIVLKREWLINKVAYE